uniref:Protein Wnt n=1 Tax=Himerometra robustipinna TaxID=706653 RepID=A0A5B8GTF4_9ECHI|nr:Wnt16 [Himerometra robustipinna]
MWLGVSSVGVSNTVDVTYDSKTCKKVPGLVRAQKSVCQKEPETVRVIGEGARMGIYECQEQFQHERWNCTILPDDADVFGKMMKVGTKETAFVYAVTSAGVVHAVTRSCSLGNLSDCTCDSSKKGPINEDGWRWGGCSDDVNYGLKISRDFIDVADSKNSENSREKARSLMNLHNNEVGRQAVESQMQPTCRCHGVSGSCAMKTCWNSMPDFRKVGQYLKKLHKDAVEILPRGKKRLRRKDPKERKVPIKFNEMVHIDESPNYCSSDPDKGIKGTNGRECNKTSNGADGCNLLCCGRGYNTQEVRIVERCDCVFIWCCEVKCKSCETVRDVHTCK